MSDDDKQQIYHAAPNHPLWDILENIAPIGLAVPGDGDIRLIYYKDKP